MIRFLLPAMVLAGAGLTAAPVGAAELTHDAASEASTRGLYLALIRQARTDGRPRAAIAYLDDFDRRHPDDRDAQILRVNCLLDLSRVDEARRALARIPASDHSGAALAIRGHVMAAQGDWTGASAQYTAALQASPADPFIANALGYALLRAGQAQAAVEALRSAGDLAPDDAVLRNNLILALTVSGRLGEAEALLARVQDGGERSRLRRQVAGEAARIAAAGAIVGPVTGPVAGPVTGAGAAAAPRGS
ncbi:tetratricopeptide repeat protein [Novosphingobium soli]|uniref:Tetratricopeptide repeat protein n=1 Tax=Novosphingobium soli TaxID=574956 RepID=A0ABV6CVA5_9SPHN